MDDLILFARQAEELAVVPLEGPARPVEIAYPFMLWPERTG